MIIDCNSCQKKFNVPDSAITEAGRLLQCGSCGNKWTQYPIKERSVKNIKKSDQSKTELFINTNKKKNLVKRKKREVNLYSEEYLKKKHGLIINGHTDSERLKKNRNITTSSFGFFNYLIITTIFIITLFGILHMSKDIIISEYPIAELYIKNLYEVFNIMKILIFDLIS